MALNSIFPRNASADASADGAEVFAVSSGVSRSQSVQRLQIGFAGMTAMALLIGLAQVIIDRAQESEAETVPAAAATVAPAQPAPVQNDPLAEVGVVPDLPRPAAQPSQEPAVMPEQGNAPPSQ